MQLKDGFQVCQNCGGGGCYWCRKEGWRAQCPRCGNSEPELLVKDEDNFVCLACESNFEKNGQLLPNQNPPKKSVVKEKVKRT